MKITNPEKQCQSVPTALSAESEIITIETSDRHAGIVLDSPEEFANALIAYDNGSVSGSRATQNRLMDDIGNLGGGMAAPVLLISGLEFSNGFIEKLVKDALSGLKSEGRFEKSFDYDAMGTNFFKSTIGGTKVGDKYVLELSAAYVGSKPEVSLAEALNKPRALVRSSLDGALSVVDDWWFNVNLENVLKGLPLKRKDLTKVSRYIVSDNTFGDKPEMTFKYDGNKYSLNIGLDSDRHLRPENGSYESKFIRLRGSNIVGGAWTTYGKDGEKISPTVKNPSIHISVSVPCKGYSTPFAVTAEQMAGVKKAREYIRDCLIQ